MYVDGVRVLSRSYAAEWAEWSETRIRTWIAAPQKQLHLDIDMTAPTGKYLKSVLVQGYASMGGSLVFSSTALSGTVKYQGSSYIGSLGLINFRYDYALNTGTLVLSDPLHTNLTYSLNYGSTLVLPTPAIPDNFEFLGWSTGEDDSGTRYAAGSTYKFQPASNGDTVTLYAVWNYIPPVVPTTTSKPPSSDDNRFTSESGGGVGDGSK